MQKTNYMRNKPLGIASLIGGIVLIALAVLSIIFKIDSGKAAGVLIVLGGIAIKTGISDLKKNKTKSK